MNNYRNYGNYGNRRVMGNMEDCGAAKNRMMQGMECKKEEKQDCSCGCQDMTQDVCDCKVESMYCEEKKNNMYCEGDMQGKALAMAYVPWQGWQKLYEVCEGFANGTIFKELDLEFLGRRCN